MSLSGLAGNGQVGDAAVAGSNAFTGNNTFAGTTTLNGAVSAPSQLAAPVVTSTTATPGAGGNVNVGAHDWLFTYTNANGETVGSAHVQATVAASAKIVTLANIPTGPAGTIGRKCYRSKLGTTSPLFLVTLSPDISADNTTTSATDNTADASLPATTAPIVDTTGPTATVNNKVDASQYGIVTRVKAGVPVDLDYATAPPNGTLVVDSTDNKLYIRYGGAWHFVALT